MSDFLLLRLVRERRPEPSDIDRLERAMQGASMCTRRIVLDEATVLILRWHPDDDTVPGVVREVDCGMSFLGDAEPEVADIACARKLLCRDPDSAWFGLPVRAIAWCNRQVRVFADPAGRRSVCHAGIRDGVLVASQPRFLLAHPEVSTTPDRAVLLRRLAWVEPPATRSVYRDIDYLGAGEVLDVDGVCRRTSVWARFEDRPDAAPGEQAWYASFDDTLRMVTEDGLARTGGKPFGLLLSGGLDSSVLAGRIAAHGADGRCVAVMFRYPGLSCDESEFQDAALASRKFRPLPIEPLAFDPERDLFARIRASKLPPLRVDPEFQHALQLLARREVRHLWSGAGGDELFIRQFDSPLDQLVAARPDEALALWRAMPLRGVLASLREHLPKRPRAWLRRRRYPAWLSPEACRELGLENTLEPAWRLPGEVSLARDRRHACATTGRRVYTHEFHSLTRDQAGVCMHDPFLDPRLIELAVRMPERLRWLDDDDRHFQRRLNARLLPAAIRHRRGKVHFDARHVQDLAHPRVAELLEDMELERAGLVRSSELRRMRAGLLEALGTDPARMPNGAPAVWAAVGIEAWWRTLVA